MIEKIISGGQTGVDTAALDAAIQCGIEYGGWCPQGRLNETGKIDAKYIQLQEIAGDFKDDKVNYDTRTKLNIQDSDATLILVPKIPLSSTIQDGTILTISEAKEKNKPFLIVDLSKPLSINKNIIINWLIEQQPKILNIAGPRESSSKGIYQHSLILLKGTLFQLPRTLRPRL